MKNGLFMLFLSLVSTLFIGCGDDKSFDGNSLDTGLSLPAPPKDNQTCQDDALIAYAKANDLDISRLNVEAGGCKITCFYGANCDAIPKCALYPLITNETYKNSAQIKTWLAICGPGDTEAEVSQYNLKKCVGPNDGLLQRYCNPEDPEATFL